MPPPTKTSKYWFIPAPLSSAAEELLDLAMPQLHPRRPTVVALARTRGRFHFAEQRVHFRDRQDATGPNRSVTGDRGCDMIQTVAQSQRPAHFRNLGCEVRQQPFDVRRSKRGRCGAHK